VCKLVGILMHALRAGPNGKDVATRCAECGTHTFKCTYTPISAGQLTDNSGNITAELDIGKQHLIHYDNMREVSMLTSSQFFLVRFRKN